MLECYTEMNVQSDHNKLLFWTIYPVFKKVREKADFVVDSYSISLTPAEAIALKIFLSRIQENLDVYEKTLALTIVAELDQKTI